MKFDENKSPWTSLGFTDLEASIYTLLLAQFPATGYKLAKGLGKPAANTYKALESLERKGAVMVEEGTHRLFRPVSPANLLRQLDGNYQRLRKQAEEILADIQPATRDDRVYRIRSASQVLDRAGSMLRNAKEMVLIDAFPGAMDILEDQVRETVARGVLIGIKTYAPTEIEGAIVVCGNDAGTVQGRWPGSWLNMVADGARYMMAILDNDLRQVFQAVWTECPYLSWVHHCAFSSEIILAAMDARIESGASADELKASKKDLSRLIHGSGPGYRSIMQAMDEEGSQAKGD